MKCVEGECVMVECSDLNGIQCPQGTACTKTPVNTAGNVMCCLQVCMTVQ
jgi:hypothetical protein